MSYKSLLQYMRYGGLFEGGVTCACRFTSCDSWLHGRLYIHQSVYKRHFVCTTAMHTFFWPHLTACSHPLGHSVTLYRLPSPGFAVFRRGITTQRCGGRCGDQICVGGASTHCSLCGGSGRGSARCPCLADVAVVPCCCRRPQVQAWMEQAVGEAPNARHNILPLFPKRAFHPKVCLEVWT